MSAGVQLDFSKAQPLPGQAPVTLDFSKAQPIGGAPKPAAAAPASAPAATSEIKPTPFLDKLTQIRPDNPNDSIGSRALNFVGNIGGAGLNTILNPVSTVKGIGHSIAHPEDTVRGLYEGLNTRPGDTTASLIGQAGALGPVSEAMGPMIGRTVAKAGSGLQDLAEANLNRRIAPSTNDMKYGQSPGRGILSSGIGTSTRKGLLNKISSAKDTTGGMIGDVVNSADTNANAPVLTSKSIRTSIDEPINKRIGEVTGPGRTTANPEVPYDTFRQSMNQTAPGAKSPVYGPGAPDTVLPSDVWKTTKNLDKNTRFNPDPEVESANEIKRDVRGGLRKQLETVDPNIKPLSRNYGDLSSAETGIERDNSPMFRAEGLHGLVRDTIDSYPVNTAISSGLYKTGGALKRLGGVPETPFAANNWSPKNPARPLGLPSETISNYGEGPDLSIGSIPGRAVRTGQPPPSRLALPSIAGSGEPQPMVGILKHPGAQRDFQPQSLRIEPPTFNQAPTIPVAPKGWTIGPKGEIVRNPFAQLSGAQESIQAPPPENFYTGEMATPMHPPASAFRAKPPRAWTPDELKILNGGK